MRQRCINAVEQVIGRAISQVEAKDIEARILRNMRQLNRQDPNAWAGMTSDQRLMAAAQAAAAELREQAFQKKRTAALSIAAHDRNETIIADAKASGLTGLDAVRRLVAFDPDGKSTAASLETEGRAVRNDAMRRLVDTFTAIEPRLFGLFENRAGQVQLIKALFGQPSGDPKVDAGAKAWHDTTDMLRNLFNEYGGKIRELEDWALPQHHSQAKVSRAGRDQWVQDTMPLLDRSKYWTPDGGPMTDAQVIEFLNAAWETLATGGINKLTPGGPKGAGMLSNRNAEARSIHFDGADAYLQYQQKYGERDLWNIMVGHVEGLAKQIAQLKQFGPNPDAALKLFVDREMQRAALADPTRTGEIEAEARQINDLYDFYAGNVQPIASQRLAENFDTLRSWNVAPRLGSSVVTAFFTDPATINLTAQANKLPSIRLWVNQLANYHPFGAAERNLAHRQGLAIDIMLGELNRWGQDNLGAEASSTRAKVASKVASTVMRLSLLPALDSANRRAFGVTMMHALGETVSTHADLASLTRADHALLLSKGITEANFGVWKLAQLENWNRGNDVLTPSAVARVTDVQLAPIVVTETATLQAELATKVANVQGNAALSAQQIAESVADWTRIYNERIAGLPNKLRMDAIHRLLGIVQEETDMAVIQPGLRDRFRTGGADQKGTWKGELTRSVWQFKGFPMAMIFRHFGRGLGQDTVRGKGWYLAKLVVGTWLLGILAQSANDLATGKDVRNYSPLDPFGVRNNIAALLKGGALGLYGDFLFAGTTQTSRTGPVASMLGPVAGTVEETFNLTQGNLVQSIQGKDTNFGAEATRWLRGNTPGASLWYLKAALDHLIWHQMQENFTPGYLIKTQQRTRQETGQDYWWQPGTGPEGMRAPQIGETR